VANPSSILRKHRRKSRWRHVLRLSCQAGHAIEAGVLLGLLLALHQQGRLAPPRKKEA
jgi:hypothetical protein